MIHTNKITRYELFTSSRITTYEALCDNYDLFEVDDDDYFKENRYIDDVTKERFGVLFADGSAQEIEYEPDKSEFTIDYKHKEDVIMKVNTNVLLLAKLGKQSIYKFYGVYTIDNIDNTKITLTEFNPTYYKDINTVKFDWELKL